MKLKFNAILAVAALCGVTFAAEPPNDAPKPADVSETDEIDLDKLDDSADAARKAPTVTFAQPAATPAAPRQTAASQPTPDSQKMDEVDALFSSTNAPAPAAAQTARAFGARIEHTKKIKP